MIVSLVGRAGWAGSVGRWVDTGMDLRVRPPQIEAQGLAFACQFAENVLQGAGGYSWGVDS